MVEGLLWARGSHGPWRHWARDRVMAAQAAVMSRLCAQAVTSDDSVIAMLGRLLSHLMSQSQSLLSPRKDGGRSAALIPLCGAMLASRGEWWLP